MKEKGVLTSRWMRTIRDPFCPHSDSVSLGISPNFSDVAVTAAAPSCYAGMEPNQERELAKADVGDDVEDVDVEDEQQTEREARGHGWDPAVAEKTVDEAERARGAFLGLAWGDVFGCPIEGWKPGSIAKVYGNYDRLPSSYPIAAISAVGKSYTRKLRPIGLYSDDTQQCMILINMCLVDLNEGKELHSGHNDEVRDDSKEEHTKQLQTESVRTDETNPGTMLESVPKGKGRVSRGPGPAVRVEWNVRKWGRTLAEMFQREALRNFGRNFKEAVARLNHNVRPQQSGSKSEGMGAAMRTGALGALFRYDAEVLAACAWESSLTTHATLPAAAMSYAVAYAVAGLVRGESAEEVRDKLPNAVSAREKHWLLNHGEWDIRASTENCHLISSCLRTVFSDLDLSDRAGLRRFISDNAKPHLAEGVVKAHPNQGHVLLGGVHGLIMALLPNIHPQEILREVVVLGYDTDTVAAICGSVLGARFGVGWIPLHLILERERLQAYAEALALAGRAEDKRRPSGLESLEELIEKEIALTAWSRSVKRQNNPMNAGGSQQVQRGTPTGKQGSDEEEESGRRKGRKGRKGKKGRR